MKQRLEDKSNSFFVKVGEDRQLLFDILINLFPDNNQLVFDLCQAFEIREFELGDELVDQAHNSQGCYIICQGQVRLVSFHTTLQREIAVSLLGVGESYGADELFDDRPQSYRAIAASSGIVAVIPMTKLKVWCDRLSQLSDYLIRMTANRQTLIFFKTVVNLQTPTTKLSSHTLKELLSYLVEIKIPAGEVLSECTSCDTGRFWLRSGQIHSPENPSLLCPKIGDSWAYPEPVTSDWIAQTDLLVYQLPIAHWEIAQAIAPQLLGVPASKSIQKKARSRQIPTNPTPILNSQAPSSQPESNLIAFPQPSKQRRSWLGKRYPFIQQQSISDCGPACLAMISQYWGKKFSMNMLRNLANVARAGASLKSLAVAAETIGFQARPVRASFNRIANQHHPWIAHWQGDHYIVVYQVQKNHVIVSDPAIGRKKLTLQAFQAGWTGFALLLSPTPQLKAVPSSKPSLGKFWGAFLPYRAMLWPIMITSLLLQVFGLITPLFTQIILDQVVVHKSLSTLHIFVIGLLVFSLWRIALVNIRQYMLDYFSNRVDLTLITGFITHTLNLPLQFFATRHVGDIMTRVQENHKIQVFLTKQAIAAWLDALTAIVYVGLMAYYNWQLTLLVLALLPPIILLTVAASPILRQVSREIFNEAAKQNSSLVEMLTGVATVKAAAAERDLRWLWEDHLTSTVNAKFRGQKLAIGLQVISGLINTLGSTALLWYSATLVIQDQLSIGQLVAFNMLIGNVIGPILSLVGLWDELQEVMVSVERLDDVFNTQAEETPEKSMLVLPPLRGDVQFENVTFRYGVDDERNILQNISFTAHPGQTIAIVGRSGSGKSTLVSLLQGLYHPTNGKILVDGHDIRHVSPQSLRRQLGVVPQECFLFSGTILENITLYREQYSLEEVIEVSKLAEAHAFIQSLPLGYNTKVGERGSSLSGGQRQRIAIARAILSNPKILILDEATSSLDTESERRFQQNLQRISKERTTFIIAHRLSTVRSADSILVLDKGVIVEQGNHDELMKLRSLYFHLVHQQIDV
ncbi:ABC-type bacteriocin/lantibiotic exporter with N-terminal double-glycine peptidase domain [Nostoc sp. PCC 7524]|uniref:ABC transporter transmembrane domain-containing protein n=1 Tax=Nostoc sp. (strain ATCC 29411 / PCC 7524) TaxID=28072 RepID=UPI00029F05B6|nr:peptidase domain-containing ABC transporter [Nostoc sp. PCC 7524]AFY50393.1 ABC-type bacteriocin/lantibiotic exporter with N-terminal double-glycine peptidase domain [Nostoc sp. PCC 7524]